MQAILGKSGLEVNKRVLDILVRVCSYLFHLQTANGTAREIRREADKASQAATGHRGEKMLSSFRDRFGTAGLVVAITALVLALAGGAYAASGALTGKQKKEVEKIAKKYAGKPGAPGANGANGAPGAKGDAGAAGSAGAAGKSVTTGNATGAECSEGGSTVEVEGTPASKEKICNGEEGPAGPPGPTCAAGACLLPVGATETGVWSAKSKHLIAFWTSISFPLRLTSAPTLVWVPPLGSDPECPGTPAAPKAKPGKLCVYAQKAENVVPFLPADSEALAVDATSGATLYFETSEPELASEVLGSWAVTR